MTKYNEVIYGNYKKTNFPKQLIEYLLNKHWPASAKVKQKGSAWGYNCYNCFVTSSCIQPVKVLDVGCGDGTYLKEGFWAFHQASGIDSSVLYTRTMVNGKIKEHTDKSKTDFNTDKLPYADNSFDIVFTKSVIEHLTNTDHFLAELKRVLKPAGVVLILTPAWEYNYKDFFNDYTHVKPFHRKGLQDALRMHDFKNVKVKHHYHLPWLWGRPYLFPIVLLLRLFSQWKWKNQEENIHRVNIRFSQEVQILGVATK